MKTLKLFSLISLFAITSCAKDPCIDVTCLNGGVCDDGTCLCADWYEGEDCGTEQREKMLGEYIGDFYTCDSTFSIQSRTTTSYTRVVIGKGNDINQFQFNYWAYGSNVLAPESQFTLSVNHASTYTGTIDGTGDTAATITGEYNEVTGKHSMYYTYLGTPRYYGIIILEKFNP